VLGIFDIIYGRSLLWKKVNNFFGFDAHFLSFFWENFKILFLRRLFGIRFAKSCLSDWILEFSNSSFFGFLWGFGSWYACFSWRNSLMPLKSFSAKSQANSPSFCTLLLFNVNFP
jgi:hypothetical protein